MASTIKVDNVQNQPGTNIVSKCGTDVTLGASGDTVALACGASQTGFGRTGTVDWITTPKVTGDSPITGVTGKGYFLNTTSGTITINLPAGAAGSIVSVADYAATWDSNAVTVSPNGSEKIGGVNGDVTLNTEGQSVTLVYVDSTQGWLNTMDSTSNVRASTFIAATGGNSIVTCGSYKMHIFTAPGTFCVSSLSSSPPKNDVDYMIVGGGGAGPATNGGDGISGGGGAGGYRESPGSATCYTASPLGASPAGAVTVSAAPYAIAVGGGGPAGTGPTGWAPGSVASFNSIVGAGGGRGGRGDPTDPVPGCAGGRPGGSGGSGDNGSNAGTGNDPPTSPPQGQNGGGAAGMSAGGGGGGAGASGTGASASGGNGAIGTYTQILGSTPTAPSYGEPGPETGRYFSGGGGGANGNANYPSPGTAGTGGTGGGADGNTPACVSLSNGVVNTGGGGGGASDKNPGGGAGGNGGSGIVILRYQYT